ncbi:MAG: serine hydrolase domain-containing protein [Rikenellaceae bacterium]
MLQRLQEILLEIISISRAFVRKRRILVSVVLWSVVATFIAIISLGGESVPSDEVGMVSTPKLPKLIKRPLHRGLINSMSDFPQCKTFDKEIETFMRRWEITGASFALMRNDSLIYAKGYGYADKEKKIGCEVSNTFRIASASKLITATAIMKLIEQGKLTLGSTVFGERGILCMSPFDRLADSRMERITVEHLLRHTAGFKTPVDDPAFGNYTVAKSLGKSLPLKLDDMVEYSIRYKLRGMPGDRYDYSNLGYMILTKVIEVASGRDYESYVKQNLLEPIGCYDMRIGQNYSRNRPTNEVSYYEVKEAELYDACDGSGKRVLKSNGGNNVTLLSGAGGWVASPTEMLRFVASINGSGTKKDIISKASVETMTYDSRRDKPIGWATVRGNEWLRSGSMAGSSVLIKQQKDGYTWIFVTNSSAWIGYKLTNQISTQITRSISKVKGWTKQDLFEKGR